jgi:hypothetical protein
MVSTTAHLMHGTHSARFEATAPAGRRTVRRPVVDLAPWIAPLGWMVALAVTVTVLGAGAMLRDRVPSGATATIAVRVATSDTLWTIAEANRLPGISTESTVESIARINRLHGTTIHPGAILHVPTARVTDAAFAQADSPTVAR